MIGSAATWGRDFVAVLANEHSLFDSYVRGLKVAGWRGDVRGARRGYLGGIGHYIFVIATMPVFSAQPGKYFPVEFMEKRFEMPHDDIAERMVEATRGISANSSAYRISLSLEEPSRTIKPRDEVATLASVRFGPQAVSLSS